MFLLTAESSHARLSTTESMHEMPLTLNGPGTVLSAPMDCLACTSASSERFLRSFQSTMWMTSGTYIRSYLSLSSSSRSEWGTHCPL